MLTNKFVVLVDKVPTKTAKAIAKSIQNAFGLELTAVVKKDCSWLFEPKFNGVAIKVKQARKLRRITLVLIKDELYWKPSKNSQQWILGQTWIPTSVLSFHRLGIGRKAVTAASRIAVHEVGHIFLSYFGEPAHYKKFIWIDSSGKERLGKHCTNKRCIMYQTPGVSTPSEGYMWIGGKKTRGIGIADQKIYRNWFCTSCRQLLKKRMAIRIR